MTSLEERLARILRDAEKMAGGDVEHRIEISDAHDELDALAHAINVIVSELSFGSAQLARAKEEAERRSAELAAAQHTLLAKDRLATLGQLAGGVAHQIRNPLAIILNATSVLDRKLPNERHPDIGAALVIIQEEIRRANTIVTALLDYARPRPPSRTPVALYDVIDRVLDGDWIPANVEVKRTVADDLPVLHVDPDQIHDALLNVAKNAIEAMPDGGVLGLDAGTHDGALVIVVTDTGPGIPAALEPYLFQPLHSTKPSGVGLGLVTARTLVEGNGGRITSVPAERGARFEIRLR